MLRVATCMRSRGRVEAQMSRAGNPLASSSAAALRHSRDRLCVGPHPDLCPVFSHARMSDIQTIELDLSTLAQVQFRCPGPDQLCLKLQTIDKTNVPSPILLYLIPCTFSTRLSFFFVALAQDTLDVLSLSPPALRMLLPSITPSSYIDGLPQFRGEANTSALRRS